LLTGISLLIAACILLHSPISLHAQEGRWSTQDSLTIWTGKIGNKVSYRDIDAPDSLHCIAVGFTGTMSIARRTTDGGRTWSTVLVDTSKSGRHGRYSYNFWEVAFPTPTLCLIAADSGMIYRSTDGGDTWSIIQTGAMWDSAQRSSITYLSMVDSLHGIAGSIPLMMRTDDGGMTWKNIPPPYKVDVSDTIAIGWSELVCLGPDTYLALVEYGKRQPYIWRTGDGGAHWTSAEVDTIYTMRFIDSLHGWGAGRGQVGIAQLGYDIIARTTDGGRSWTTQLKRQIYPSSYGLLDVAFADLVNGIAVGLNGKILRTTDGGETWRTMGNLDTNAIMTMRSVTYPTRGKAWAASVQSQILFYDEGPFAGVDRGPAAMEMTLSVSPNPITGGGAIDFTTTRRGHARLGIVDAAGREVLALIDGEMEAGSHEALFDGAGLPSGRYFARLEIGERVAVAPVTIVR
jgi:photosystem II stability/assembly factor-like uncharacterized protein